MIDHGDTRHLHITFFIEAVENPAKSRAEGRPIYEDREMAEIKFVDDPKKVLVAPAHEKFMRERSSGQWVTYAQAFERHYLAFKTGEATKGEGTPIEELPFIGASRRAELKALNIHTAEALSGLESTGLSRLGLFGRELKDKATAYIERARDSALELKLAAENAALRQRLATLEERFTHAPVPEGSLPAPEPVELASWPEARLRAFVKEEGGEVPKGRPTREALVAIAEKLLGRVPTEAA